MYRILLCNHIICYFTLWLFLNFSSLLRSSDSSVEYITFDGQEKHTHGQESPSIVAHLYQSSSSKAEANQQKTSYIYRLFFPASWQSAPSDRQEVYLEAYQGKGGYGLSMLCSAILMAKNGCLGLSQLGIVAVLGWEKQASRIILVFKPSARKKIHFLPKQISYQKKNPAYQPITLFDSTCQR